MRHQLKTAFMAIAVSLVISVPAKADYPEKPISLIVPFAAGGGTDVAARITAKYLSKELDTPVNIVNQGGGNSIPGTLSVLGARADGYTLLFDSPATSSLHGLRADLPYELEKRSWGPMVVINPYLYAVNGKSEWKTLADIAAAGVADPSAIKLGWLGGSSFTDTVNLKLLDVMGIDPGAVAKVPFNGSGPSMTALAGGHINLSGGSLGAAIAFHQSGDIRILALTGDDRLDTIPEVPTAKEVGFDVPMVGWNSLSGPAGLPDEVVARLETAVQAIIKNPEFVKEQTMAGNLPKYMPAEEVWPYVQQEVENIRILTTPSE
ncbi:tripartite tricarboxylate transporter substrate binding protein [Mesorhizobium sp. Root157]|uniref:tripartite tricarboxylate transporter substrate binding protein n=1 Tax=Mesorhizobium sp. Root157 TaxID=1736477 RepID=UPI0009ECB622|nr:tripartite tricarboxylate transporter substrate binding protein [Mesorhizobium sp. Root157]